MAISTYKVFLMQKEGSEYKKLIDIVDYPDLGGKVETLDTTTLSDNMEKGIPGIQKTESLEFNTNYTLADYQKLKALEQVEGDYAVWFGGNEVGGTVTPTGEDGKYEFKGKLSVFVNGGGVNEVVKMTITMINSTVIKLAN